MQLSLMQWQALTPGLPLPRQLFDFFLGQHRTLNLCLLHPYLHRTPHTPSAPWFLSCFYPLLHGQHRTFCLYSYNSRTATHWATSRHPPMMRDHWEVRLKVLVQSQIIYNEANHPSKNQKNTHIPFLHSTPNNKNEADLLVLSRHSCGHR